MKTKKKPVTKTHKVKKQAAPKKQEIFEMDKVWYGIGFALIALAILSNIPYTQSFPNNVLGDRSQVREKNAAQEAGSAAPVRVEGEDGGSGGPVVTPPKLQPEGARGKEREMNEIKKYLAEENISIATKGGYTEMERNAVRARTNFPLSIDPETHELIVTTPAGEKRVAVLPDAALGNALFSGLLSEAAGATDSADSAGAVELEVEDENLVYKIRGKKEHKLFGFIPVSTDRTIRVSADTGEILSQTQTWLSGIIERLSF